MPKPPTIDAHAAREDGQRRFFGIIEEYVPEALNQLRQLVPLFLQIPHRLFEIQEQNSFFFYEVPEHTTGRQPVCKPAPALLYWKRFTEKANEEATLGQVRDEIIRWAQHFNFSPDDYWILDHALQALYGWANYPEWGLGWRLGVLTLPPARRFLSDKERAFRFEDIGWSIEQQSWEDFRFDLEERWNKAVSKYRSATLKIAGAKGYTPTRKTVYGARTVTLHFQWLVFYQLLGLSPTECAKKTNHRAEPQTVTSAVKSLATAIGLSIRPSKTSPSNRTRATR